MTDRDAWAAESAQYGLISLRIGDGSFGLPIRTVRELTPAVDITRVPRAPAQIVGLVNLRGRIVTVLDIRPLIGAPPRLDSAESTNQSLVVLKSTQELAPDALANGIHTTDDKVAILVDGVSDVHALAADAYLPPPPNLVGLRRQHIFAICQVDSESISCLVPSNLVCAEVSDDLGISAPNPGEPS